MTRGGELPYVLLGAAAAADRQARRAATVGGWSARIALLPAVGVWRSPLAAPVRDRAAALVDGLGRDGRLALTQSRADAELRLRQAQEQLIETRVIEQAFEQLLESRVLDGLVDRLLASEEMRKILEHVTSSPELRAALARQTAGLAGDMAVGVRSRTVRADDATERFARSLLGRRHRQTPVTQ